MNIVRFVWCRGEYQGRLPDCSANSAPKPKSVKPTRMHPNLLVVAVSRHEGLDCFDEQTMPNFRAGNYPERPPCSKQGCVSLTNTAGCVGRSVRCVSMDEEQYIGPNYTPIRDHSHKIGQLMKGHTGLLAASRPIVAWVQPAD